MLISQSQLRQAVLLCRNKTTKFVYHCFASSATSRETAPMFPPARTLRCSTEKKFFVVAASPADTEKAPRKGLSTKAFEGQSLDQLVNQGRLING